MRNKNIWIFNAGNAFSGNPKWLFEYIVNYHPEITPWWFCYERELEQHMKELGFNACRYDSALGREIGSKAGVYVVNQFKEIIEDYLDGITIINLWHGVGCKTVEREVTTGFLHERIVRKHIMNRRIYDTQQLFLASSPLMEKHFTKQCGIDEDKFIRAGYPCCTYPGELATYDHDILQQKGLPASTKIAAYVPTYRDNEPLGFLTKALPDMSRLIEVLEDHNMLLIMKMHPQMEENRQYLAMKERYGNDPHLLFWDNANDFYEIFDQIDLGIIDYSSIFYDMLARGVKHFIRYFYDLDEGESVRDFVFDVREMTCGIEATDFESLLQALSSYEQDDPEDVARINDLFWAYSTPDSCEKIVEAALSFVPDTSRPEKILYSFDIFDTLIARTTLQPEGVFQYVQEKINQSGLGFPAYLTRNYVEARRCCEQNCREYVVKSVFKRDNDHTEIDFPMIFDRMADVYGITPEQGETLMKWELECEYNVSVPIKENIDRVKSLLANGETVVLISDMYLSREFVTKLLAKADPVLTTVPLFLSSDIGYQKTKKTLYFHVFHSFDYRFDRWIHTGDNELADVTVPSSLGIDAQLYTGGIAPSFHADELREAVGSYDAYQIGRLISRFDARKDISDEARFAYCYASLFFVPYVSWAIDDALANGVKCLYFISRDGYHLKRIADAIIKQRKLPIKSKYIYGSRKAWRIPSQVHEIDEDFYTDHGNFNGIRDFVEFLDAAAIDEETFLKMFPELARFSENHHFEVGDNTQIRNMMRDSQEYTDYLLAEAAKRRVIVLDYLKQEIDFSEKFAFVEFWGRGYTQTCLSNLLREIDPSLEGSTFYYARSIYPSEGGDIRRNITSSFVSLIFIESIFANIPIKTVPGYYRTDDGKIEPIIRDNDYLKPVFDALDTYLPEFAHDYAALDLLDPTSNYIEMFNFGIGHFRFNATQDIYLKCVAPLKDSVTIYGDSVEFAPEWTFRDSIDRVLGKQKKTRDRDMSLARSKPIFKAGFKLFSAGKATADFLKDIIDK